MSDTATSPSPSPLIWVGLAAAAGFFLLRGKSSAAPAPTPAPDPAGSGGNDAALQSIINSLQNGGVPSPATGAKSGIMEASGFTSVADYNAAHPNAPIIVGSGTSLLAVATNAAPPSAPLTAPTVAASWTTVGDGYSHRGTPDDVTLNHFSQQDQGNIQALCNYFHISVEDVVDVVSFQERRDRDTWSNIIRGYGKNPSWFHDVAVEYNATNPRYPVRA